MNALLTCILTLGCLVVWGLVLILGKMVHDLAIGKKQVEKQINSLRHEQSSQ